MHPSLRAAISCLSFLSLALLCLCLPAASHAQGIPSIQRVQVLHSGAQLEIEIEASDHIVPQTNVLTNPDRLVVDFVNARPGARLRNLSVNRAEAKNLRVGLFSSDPPVTRLVLDLNGPQPFQVFPSGRTVIVKIGETSSAQSAAARPASGAVLVNANYATKIAEVPASGPSAAVRPRLEVTFQNGQLSVSSNRASLSEVLFAIHQRTGAEIAIPAGAEQEQVAVDLGPAPAPELLAHLLNGSKFNFMILSSATDPKALDRVILSPRAEGPMSMSSPLPPPTNDDGSEAGQPVDSPAPSHGRPSMANEGPIPPAGSPETKPPDADPAD